MTTQPPLFEETTADRRVEAARRESDHRDTRSEGARFGSEAAFQSFLEEHFASQGAIVTPEAWCNVHSDMSDKKGRLRRADLHVQFANRTDWPLVAVVECKLWANWGDMLDGGDQATAYVRGFGWRTEPGQHNGRRLSAPDLSIVAWPELLTPRGDPGASKRDATALFERMMWQRGVALLSCHRGPVPGLKVRFNERTYPLTGRWQ